MGRVRASKSALLHANARTSGRSVSKNLPLSNRQIAELLAVRGEKEESYKRKAYFRAAHAAFMWPVEAAEY